MHWAEPTTEFVTSVWLFDNPVEPGDGWLSVEGGSPERVAINGANKRGMENVVLTNVIDSILRGAEGSAAHLRPTEFIVGEIDRVARMAGIEPVGPKASQVMSKMLSRSLRLAQKVYDFSIPGRTITETIAPSIAVENRYSKAIRGARPDTEKMLPVQTFARTPEMIRARMIAPWAGIVAEINEMVLPIGKWQTTRATVSDLESLGDIQSFATVVAVRAVHTALPEVISKAIPQLASGKTVWMPASAAAWMATICALDIEEARRSEAGARWGDDELIAFPFLGKIADCTVSADVIYGAHVNAIWEGVAAGASSSIVRWWLMWAVRIAMLKSAAAMSDRGAVVTDIGVGAIGVAVREDEAETVMAAGADAGLVYQRRETRAGTGSALRASVSGDSQAYGAGVMLAQIRAAAGAAYPAVAMELDRSNEVQAEKDRKLIVRDIMTKIQDGEEDFSLE